MLQVQREILVIKVILVIQVLKVPQVRWQGLPDQRDLQVLKETQVTQGQRVVPDSSDQQVQWEPKELPVRQVMQGLKDQKGLQDLPVLRVHKDQKVLKDLQDMLGQPDQRVIRVLQVPLEVLG